MTDGKWLKAKREREPDLIAQQRALLKGALATGTDQGGYVCTSSPNLQLRAKRRCRRRRSSGPVPTRGPNFLRTKAKRVWEPDLIAQQRALEDGALATGTDQGGYACRGLRKTALESEIWEPDLHAQLRALEDGALATDTDPGDGLL